MNQSIMVMFNGVKLCHKGQAFIDGLPSNAGPIEAYNRAPNGAWIVWGCSKCPATLERVRRLVAVAALYARAVLPLVPEEHRAIVERCIGYAEAIGRGEAIDNDAAWDDADAAEAAAFEVRDAAFDNVNVNADANAAACAAASYAAAAASDRAVVFYDPGAADIRAACAAAAASNAVDAVAAATEPARACVSLPSADDVRAILGLAEYWL